MIQRLKARLAQWMQPQSELTISRRIHRIEKDLHALTEQHEDVFRQLRHLQSGIDGLVRAAYIDPSSCRIPSVSPPVDSACSRRIRKTASCGRSSSKSERQPRRSSSSEVARPAATRRCWRVNSAGPAPVEGDQGKVEYAGRRFPRAKAVCAWITPETVNDLLERNGFAGEVDLLSVDVDGVDYWVWQAITVCSARLVMLEYNSMFGRGSGGDGALRPEVQPSRSSVLLLRGIVVSDDPVVSDQGLSPRRRRAHRRQCVLPSQRRGAGDSACDPAHVYRIPDKYNELIRKKQLDVFKWARETGRELVDMGEPPRALKVPRGCAAAVDRSVLVLARHAHLPQRSLRPDFAGASDRASTASCRSATISIPATS